MTYNLAWNPPTTFKTTASRMGLFRHRGITVLFLAGGIAAAMAIGPAIKGKPPLVSLPASCLIGIVAVVLIAWNVMMYRKAAVQRDPDFPVSAFERYTAPVFATVAFLVGLATMFF